MSAKRMAYTRQYESARKSKSGIYFIWIRSRHCCCWYCI
ncbi:hypothetical protein [Acinetobacter sp. 742879]